MQHWRWRRLNSWVQDVKLDNYPHACRLQKHRFSHIYLWILPNNTCNCYHDILTSNTFNQSWANRDGLPPAMTRQQDSAKGLKCSLKRSVSMPTAREARFARADGAASGLTNHRRQIHRKRFCACTCWKEAPCRPRNFISCKHLC